MLNGRGGRTLYCGATMAVAVTADVATKSWAAARLSGGRDITAAGPLVQLRLVVNHGATLGLAASAEPLLAVIAVAGMLLLGAWALRATGTAERTGAALAAAGAAGNLIDRLFRAPAVLHGGVIDWIHLSFYGPTFNLADVWLRAGLVIAVIGWLRGRRTPPRTRFEPDPRGGGTAPPGLFVVLGGVGGAAGGGGPLHGAGLGLGEVPAGGVLGVVVAG